MRRPPDEVGNSATGQQLGESQKGLACPKAGPNRRRHRSAAPLARRATAPERVKALFLFHRARRILFLAQPKREWGAHPYGNSPLREQDPPWPPDSGPSPLPQGKP